MISGHCWSLIFTTATTILIDKNGIHGAQVSFQIMAVGSLAALILCMPIESKLKRQQIESDINSEHTPSRQQELEFDNNNLHNETANFGLNQ